LPNVKYNLLEKFVVEALKKAGLDEYSTNAVATGLLESSLRGVDSHGVRLLPHYIKSAQTGRKNPKPNFKFKAKYPTLVSLDADNGYGHAAGFKAIDYAMEVADKFGTCTVGVFNSSHPGAMASFSLRAARKGYMAFAFTHADSLMLSHNGTKPYFGTNPVCFAAPREGMEPYSLDMATTKIPWNRVLLSRENNVAIGNDLVADDKGDVTTDPNLAKCILPLGEHKGYALSSMVEVLCSIFTGVPFGTSILSMYKSPMEKGRNLGQFYTVMKTDACVSAEDFAQRLTAMTKEVHAQPRKGSSSVILPGDKEIEISKDRKAEGVPVDQSTLDAFAKLKQDYKIEANLYE
jgi:LDH2 family malate/lactate/ureidoglycolate dehydrogenase